MTPMAAALESYDEAYQKLGPTKAVEAAILAYLQAAAKDEGTVEAVRQAITDQDLDVDSQAIASAVLKTLASRVKA